MFLIPVNNFVIIDKVDDSKTLSSGIILTRNLDAYTSRGVVAFVCKDSVVKVGDIVLFPSTSGRMIKPQGKEFTVIDQSEIFCIEEEEIDE